MDMVAYEFYFRNRIKGDELIGILPERRRKPERVTQESIMKWAKIVFSDAIDMNSIYFVPIKLEKSLNGNYFPRP
jgi:hypothetical protein